MKYFSSLTEEHPGASLSPPHLLADDELPSLWQPLIFYSCQKPLKVFGIQICNDKGFKKQPTTTSFYLKWISRVLYKRLILGTYGL